MQYYYKMISAILSLYPCCIVRVCTMQERDTEITPKEKRFCILVKQKKKLVLHKKNKKGGRLAGVEL